MGEIKNIFNSNVGGQQKGNGNSLEINNMEKKQRLKDNTHNNQMDRKERLNLAVTHLVDSGIVCPKSTQKNLAEKTGYPEQSIAGAIGGNEMFLTDGFFRKFNTSFENIFSIEWLLNGKGKMLSEEEKQQIKQNVNVDGNIIGTETVCGHTVSVVGISNNDEIEYFRELLAEKDRIITEKDLIIAEKERIIQILINDKKIILK